MFEQNQKSKLELGPKLLIGFAVGAALGFGMCGLGLLLPNSTRVVGYFSPAGAVIFFLCLAGLVLTAVVMAIAAIVRSFRK